MDQTREKCPWVIVHGYNMEKELTDYRYEVWDSLAAVFCADAINLQWTQEFCSPFNPTAQSKG